MATMYIPTEQDVKQWVKEAMQESFAILQKPPADDEPLLSRKEVSKLLHVSLVTLNDWVKRGLPSHKQRGRVYFLKSEVMGFIREGGGGL
jgi:hypothetical protein